MSSPVSLPKREPRRSGVPWLRLALLILAIAGVTIGIGSWRRPQPVVRAPAAATAAPTYVGAEACKGCHAEAFGAWSGSHHQLAMQQAAPESVLGDFAGATFEHAGDFSRFLRRDGKFLVHTAGPDGTLADFEVRYTFGVAPLQQYLVELPGGRLQAWTTAWDSRPAAEGGQRWFHLGEDFAPGDPLHWSGRYQNWNLMCAECHSTALKKGYDDATDRYHTTFSEINVACEACHGPGSRHVEWATRGGAAASGDGHGLTVELHSRWAEAWSLDTARAGFPRRDRPAAAAVGNVCAPCHARRSTIAEGGHPGAPLEDTHRLELLESPNYHVDGQQLDEVYTWASFRQSKMFQAGVTCLDCHDPHSTRPRAAGNALCARCHSPSLFDTAKHHFHPPGSAGAQCTGCHMPARNYMVVHPRLDHSLRVPRPDLSVTLGTPNACSQCHAERDATWAATAMDGWYGTGWRARPEYGTTLHLATTDGARALPRLLELARSPSWPAIVRATAASLAAPVMSAEQLPAARALLADPDPTVRIAALGLLEPLDGAARLAAAAPLLADPVRGVRIDAARVLADLPESQLAAGQLAARARALEEYRAALALNADWPAEVVNLGNLELRLGRTEPAIAAYERALRLDPDFAGAYVNLADTYRLLGDDERGEQALRRGLELLPEAADLHHALGLVLVRRGQHEAAMAALATARKLAPGSARYAYVLAIALHSAGQVREALALLRETDEQHAYDVDVLGALVSILREEHRRGDPAARAEALTHARRLAEALPGDPAVQETLKELEAGR